jgi:hypothetical protein
LQQTTKASMDQQQSSRTSLCQVDRVELARFRRFFPQTIGNVVVRNNKFTKASLKVLWGFVTAKCRR